MKNSKFARIMFSIFTGVLMSCVSHFARTSAVRDRRAAVPQTEASVPILPTSTDRVLFDKMESLRAVSDSEKGYEDEPEHDKAEEWMAGLEIPCQVLYEDEQFKLEITGYEIEGSNLYINTRFTNGTDHTVKARAMEDSVFINHMDSTMSIYFGYSIKPGETEENVIYVSSFYIPWYDSILEELEFSLQVQNEDENDRHSDQYILLETDPIMIRPVSADGKPVENLLSSDPEIKVLFENEDVRVISTGIYEKRFLKNGVPNLWSSTYWEILVENNSRHDVELTDIDCQVNGKNALLFDDSKVIQVPAGRRDTGWIQLYGGMHDVDTADQITSVMEVVEKTRWTLDQIRTGSLEFTVNCRDSSGALQNERVETSYTGFTGGDDAPV